MSLAQLQEVSPKSLVLLVGLPGSGKSTFCQQTVLQNLVVDRPVIYVTTEYGPSDAEKALKERGLGEIELGLLNFVDAYNETVGVSVPDRPDTVRADCANLSSIAIAISKLQESIGKKGVLLVFDSLVSPYLLSGPEVVRFLRLTLSRFVAEGNSVLMCMDEGCGKQEDLGAMMSLSSGVLKMEVEKGKRTLNVVKHPDVKPTKIEVSTTPAWVKTYGIELTDREMLRRFLEAQQSGALNTEFGQYEVNIFWPIFARWSGIIWDPKRFPTMMYDLWKEFSFSFKDMIALFPWHMKFFFKIRMPKNFNKVKDMKKLSKFYHEFMGPRLYGIIEYLEDVSKTDEHYFRIYENFECCGFENIGTTMSSIFPSLLAGLCKGFEYWKGLERDWNAVETKCIGLGDPYCEIKLVPGEIDELEGSLEKDITVIERIFHERLIHRLVEFVLHGNPLVERPKLGSDFYMTHPEMSLPAVTSERYQMALRMGGAKAGKEVGEHMMDVGMGEDDAVKRFLRFLEYCRVGKVTLDETMKIKDNCESRWTQFMTTKLDEPLCFFTTGFLNGFFSAVKNQHVTETRCIAMGDPYCEWEFR